MPREEESGERERKLKSHIYDDVTCVTTNGIFDDKKWPNYGKERCCAPHL
jgi:hypothetical protein